MSRATTFQKSVLIFIVVFVGGSMVFYFGNFGGMGGGGRADEVGAAEVLAEVGGQKITAVEYRQQLAEAAQQRRQYTGEDVTYEQMATDGTAQEVLDSLVSAKIVDTEAAKHRLDLDRETLVGYLKQETVFQNEQGQFDPARWNQWVQQQQGNINWDELYQSVEWGLTQQAFGQLVQAPARVLDSEVRELYAEQNTQLRVRYVSVAPDIEVTEEQLRAHFETNQAQYQLPAERNVAFVSVSLKPSRPAVLDEVLAKARAGEDFGELAKQYSTLPTKDQGGEIGWLRQGAPMPDYEKAVLELAPGDVSEPFEDRGVYYIYQVVEERTDPETTQREVKARVIGIQGELAEEEKTARMEAATAIATEAKSTHDLRAVAAAHDLYVSETGFFSIRSPQVTNVPDADAFAFRQAFEEANAGGLSEVIEGPENLYVGQVLEVKPPVQQTFEEVREQVGRAVQREVQESEEYRNRLQTYSEQIKEQAQQLTDIARLFPELNAQIETSKPFTVNDYLVAEGLYWNNRQIFQEFRGKQPGAMAGPIADMMGGKVYFVELAERIEPSDEIWGEQWENAKAQMRETLLRQRQQEFGMDYVANLRDQAEQTTPVSVNEDLYMRILGLGQEEDAAAAEGAPAAEAPVEAAPVDQAPAEPAQ
jgi:peptidyl-prolyl cis-trans isomerase D